jgi:hypothetical protein
LILLVRLAGIEPTTPWFVGNRESSRITRVKINQVFDLDEFYSLL